MSLQTASMILRILANAPLTTKGAELTWEELDGNLIKIYQDISAKVKAGTIPDFDNTKTYSLGDAANYDDLTWLYLNATPAAGIDPGSDPAYWGEIDPTFFIHEQNKDQYLDKGGLNEVSVEDLRWIVDWKLPSDKTLDLNGHVLHTINGKKTEASEETITSDIRPVIKSINYTANPLSPLINLTDYHGLDMGYATYGDNINNKLSLYTAEFKAFNPSSGKILRLVPLYGLADSSGSGGAEDLTGLQVWTRNSGTGTVNNAYGIRVLAPVNSGGGTMSNAYGLYIPNFATASGNNYGIYSDTKSFFRKIEVSDTTVVTNLNAEKVGGKLGNTIISGSNATGTTSTSNPNTITTSGFYTAGPGATNTPYSAFWSIVVVQLNNGLNYFSQVAVNLETGDIRTRVITDGTPSSWIKTQRVTSSTTASRPTANLSVGQSHFDTTLNIPIWWNGTIWVNATGATV